MKQALKTYLPLGEGVCEQSEQTEGGMCALFLASQSSAVTPPLVAYGDSYPKGEPRINVNSSVLTVNNKSSYLKKSML